MRTPVEFKTKEETFLEIFFQEKQEKLLSVCFSTVHKNRKDRLLGNLDYYVHCGSKCLHIAQLGYSFFVVLRNCAYFTAARNNCQSSATHHVRSEATSNKSEHVWDLRFSQRWS
jgi:hypothetical protein